MIGSPSNHASSTPMVPTTTPDHQNNGASGDQLGWYQYVGHTGQAGPRLRARPRYGGAAALLRWYSEPRGVRRLSRGAEGSGVLTCEELRVTSPRRRPRRQAGRRRPRGYGNGLRGKLLTVRTMPGAISMLGSRPPAPGSVIRDDPLGTTATFATGESVVGDGQ